MLTLAGALLRFPTLDAKSFWEDEAVTVFLLREGFGDMLDRIPESERTPPVYYVLAWAWAKLFGTGEVGVRSLSAVFGVATIPVAYLAGREFVSRRAGVATAALVAVSPLLVWYSQEARAYALLALLGAASLPLTARARREPRVGTLAAWAVVASLALATHYFAVFLVAAEAAWLLATVRPRRGVVCATLLPLAIGSALAFLAVEQTRESDWIDAQSLASRTVQIPGIFLTGFEAPWPLAFAAVAGVLAVGGLLLLRRAEPAWRRGALLTGALGVAAVLLPFVLSLAGLDYLIYKNVIAAVVPLAVCVGAGFAVPAVGRMGTAAGAGLCALSVAIVALTAGEPKYGREDWRAAAEALGPAFVERAVVVTPEAGREPLMLYLAAVDLKLTGISESVAVAEIDLLAGARRRLGAVEEAHTPRPPTPAPPAAGFSAVERVEAEKFTLVRYRAAAPLEVSLATLEGAALDEGTVVVIGGEHRAGR